MKNRKPPGSGEPRAARPGTTRRQATAQPRGGSAPVRRGADSEESRSAATATAAPYANEPARHGELLPAQRTAGSPRRKPTSSRRQQPARSKWPYVAAGTAAVLALGVGTAIFAAEYFIPVDVIRDRLVAEVKTRTGRTLVVGPRASLSVWPRLSIALNDVTLSEPPSMGGAPFARAASVDAQAELWPLLSGQVKLEKLVLRNPVIDFRIDRDGRRSWDFAEALSPAVRYAQAPRTTDVQPIPKELDEFAKGATPASAEAPKARRSDDLALRNVQIVDGTIRHTDERTGASDIITAVNATIAAEGLYAPVSIEGQAIWRGRAVTTSTDARPFRAVLEHRPVAVRSQLKSQGVDLTYAGNVSRSANINLDGKVSLTAASLQDLTAWLGRPLGGGIANGALDLTANARTDDSGIALNDLSLAVDGMTVRGNVAVALAGLPRPKVAGTLQFSALNIDQLASIRFLDGQARHLPPPAAPNAPATINDLLKSKAAPTPAVPAKPQVRGFTGRPGWSDEPLDLSATGLIDADLKLGFGSLTAGKVKTGRGQLSLLLTNKVARLDVQDLQLYEGRAKGALTADATNPASAVVGANLSLDGVSALDVLRDAGGVDIVAGKARIALAIAGQGMNERQIIETLTGKAEIAMANGALVGLSISKILQALSQGRQPSFERNPSDRTEFSELSGSVNIVNGVAQNQDLRFTTQQVRVTGAGVVNLPSRTIDYVARPKLAGPQTIQVGQVTLNVGNIEVPVKIAGTFDRIAVAPDLSGVVKNPNQALESIKQLDKKDVEATMKGVLEGDPAAKTKARDFLKNLLK